MTYKLWLVRHARPEVDEGICYGQTDLPAQSQANYTAAQNLAHALDVQSSAGYLVYTSGLLRTRQLAQALQDFVPGLDLQHDARLKEMHFGNWEMQAWNEIPKENIDAWTNDFAQHRFGGIESCQDVLTRVIAAYQDMLTELKARAKPDEKCQIIWITHAGVIRALNYYLATGNSTIEHVDQWPKTAPGFGEWVQHTIEV
ncbi:histidine phosphatase family protein [Undibacterium flavidum]|uniref:Histidine phosphatase family protein n=1 Tax=Undibacterium flavidum TaxID=2762297 RepID=A0ABR6YD13_9BURK|nr:histidine phosphatase family protein [Undibacterium flavidum]MBC3874455.1 histidine phosphatase family protein [Undibacterium flavidum]